MARTVGYERKSRERSAANWGRYQAALNRTRYQGTVVQVKPEPEYHVSGECERRGCHKPVSKAIYGLGYLVGVCEEHYNAATQEERDNAVRFKYAER